MLDQHADEAFHAAERRAVDHDRAMGLVVGADVAQIETLGELVIHLHGAKLPFAADDVFDDEVDLGAVESSLAGLEREFDTERFGGLLACGLGAIPLSGLAYIFRAIG